MNAYQYIQKHDLEKAKNLISNTPEDATTISLATLQYFRKFNNPLYENVKESWISTSTSKDGLIEHQTRFAPIILPIDLSDLSQAISDFELLEDFDDLDHAKAHIVDMDFDYPYTLNPSGKRVLRAQLEEAIERIQLNTGGES
ncbi:hypothetical protein EA756_11820 [Acinetobacter lactucae]|uniref:Uncharacterized protein n=1 Tax=Acinetobacter lactucae TaxID=1785128 RepID=A0A429JYL4_9GAMM|nr:hypothetical protein [Acinetobacter lactucae]RSO56373.1 hypothetical protein EA756_11820 [Acinetobacter lactucae]